MTQEQTPALLSQEDVCSLLQIPHATLISLQLLSNSVSSRTFSLTHRVSIETAEKEKKTYILKTALPSNKKEFETAWFVDQVGFYERELILLEHLFQPKALKSHLASKNPSTPIFATSEFISGFYKTVSTDWKQKFALVEQDLQTAGFKEVSVYGEKGSPVTLQQVQDVVERLAHFHSIFYVQENGMQKRTWVEKLTSLLPAGTPEKIIDDLAYHLMQPHDVASPLQRKYALSAFMEDMLRDYAALIESFLKPLTPMTMPEFEKQVLERLVEYMDVVMEKLTESKVPQTICHADFSFSNLLFSSSDVALIDWKMATVGAGLSDLASILSELPSADRIAWQQLLLEQYYTTLTKLTGSPLFSFEQMLFQYNLCMLLQFCQLSIKTEVNTKTFEEKIERLLSCIFTPTISKSTSLTGSINIQKTIPFVDVLPLAISENEEYSQYLREKYAKYEAQNSTTTVAVPTVSKSRLVVDVYPFEDSTDLDQIADIVVNLQVPGLQWLDKGTQVTFIKTLKVLRLSCEVDNNEFNWDTLENQIMDSTDDEVQSVKMASCTDIKE